MKEIELPTLEERIKQIATQKLENDIADLHNFIYGSETEPAYFPLLKDVKINVMRDDGIEITIPLIVFFDNPVIKSAIKSKRLPEYIEREIELIINGPKNDKV